MQGISTVPWAGHTPGERENIRTDTRRIVTFLPRVQVRRSIEGNCWKKIKWGIDIGYRAKIYGYRNRFAANSIVYHAGSATSGSRYNTFKTGLASRNSIYMIYKNMPVLQIVLNLPFLIMGFLIKTLFFVRKGMGKDYVSGLLGGVKLSMSPAGRRHRQKFDKERFWNYVSIQLELWKNLVRLFV